MRGFTGFIVRLLGYALVLGIVSRVAEWLWVGRGLDASSTLQTFHDTGVTTLVVAPLVLALVGFGVLRPVAVFIAAFLVGAALTAPFALARLAGA